MLFGQNIDCVLGMGLLMKLQTFLGCDNAGLGQWQMGIASK